MIIQFYVFDKYLKLSFNDEFIFHQFHSGILFRSQLLFYHYFLFCYLIVLIMSHSMKQDFELKFKVMYYVNLSF